MTLAEQFLNLREAATFEDWSPTWYRGTASCHHLIEEPRFQQTLEKLGLKRVVMGHSPTFPRHIQTRFDNRAILADTGMLASYYHGVPSALIVEGEHITALQLKPNGELAQLKGQTPQDQRTGAEAALLDALVEAIHQPGINSHDLKPGEPLSLDLLGRSYHATFRSGSARERKMRLAAYHLDKLLGLGLVAPVIEFTAGSNDGTLELVPANSISESQRITAKLVRPNWCDGSSDYDLLFAFDMLIGNQLRDGTSIQYDRATWLMYLGGHDHAFTTTDQTVAYLKNRKLSVPRGLHTRLASLDAEALDQTLGKYLNDRQLRAVNQRMSRILNSWPVED